MNSVDNLKPDVKKWTLTSSKRSMVIGSVAVLAVAMLAGLVFTRYEAGIPPAEAAPITAQTQYIPVRVAESNPAVPAQYIPGESPLAAPANAQPANATTVFSVPGQHGSAVVGGMCSAKGPVTS